MKNIEDCHKCMNHGEKYSSSAIIHTNVKPNIFYDANKWRPKKVKILFIGEAPSYNGSGVSATFDDYFYNENEKQKIYGPPSPLLGTLSWNIFWLLDIDNNLSKKEKLELFKQKSCYYLDAIKCRAERFNNKSILNKTIKNCSEFLDTEINKLDPEYVVILGERALFALKCCTPFMQFIQESKIKDLFEITKNNPMKIHKFNIYFLPLPIWRNLSYLDIITITFSHIKSIISE